MISEMLSTVALMLSMHAWWRARTYHMPFSKIVDLIAERAAGKVIAVERKRLPERATRDLLKLPHVAVLRRRGALARRRLSDLEAVVLELSRTTLRDLPHLVASHHETLQRAKDRRHSGAHGQASP